MGFLNKDRTLVTIKSWKPIKQLLKAIDMKPEQLIQIDGYWLPLYTNRDSNVCRFQAGVVNDPRLFLYMYKYDSDNLYWEYKPNTIYQLPYFGRVKELDDFPDDTFTDSHGEYNPFIYNATDKPGIKCNCNLVTTNIGFFLKLLFLMHMDDFNLRHPDFMRVTLYHGHNTICINPLSVQWLDSMAFKTILFLKPGPETEYLTELRENCDDGQSDRYVDIKVLNRDTIKGMRKISDVYRIINEEKELE